MPYLLTFFALFLSSPCYAYLDAGSSSLLLQFILGGGAGGIMLLKIYWRKIASFFKPKGN
jgi:hypothetical protein